MVGSEAPNTLDFEFIATNLRSARRLNNFSSYLRKFIESSMENIHADASVERVNQY